MISRRVRALLWALLAITLGLVWRLTPLHLPAFAYKYGGSALYAVMLYWLLAAAFPRKHSRKIGLFALLLAPAIECFKLVHWPALDAFRITLAGKLLIGRVFTFQALVAYALAIAVVALLDRSSREKRDARHPGHPSKVLQLVFGAGVD